MPARPISPIGAHIPVGTGLARAGLPYLRDVGAETVQVFVSNPRGWAPAAGDPGQDRAFVTTCGEADIPVFIHAPYLINFGSPTDATLDKSVAALRHALHRGRQISARGVVVHAGCEAVGGSYDASLSRVRKRLRPLVAELTDADPDLLIELTAGGKGSLVSSPDGIPAYLAALDGHPKVGICVDTCHAMAAGHDLAAPGGVRRLLSAVAKTAGRGRLRLVHANDSKDPVGSARDRHEAIGKGTIGKEAFR